MKEAAPSLISNGESKTKMAHQKGTVNKVVANSSHSAVIPEYLTRTLNIGLDKANQIIRVANQHGICTAVHPIIRRYRTDHLDLSRKYISVRWYVDWMPAATGSITTFGGALVYSNGIFF